MPWLPVILEPGARAYRKVLEKCLEHVPGTTTNAIVRCHVAATENSITSMVGRYF